MAEAEIPVDLLNPGQVFACLGFMEAAEILCGPCEGRFDYAGSETEVRFRLRVDGEADPAARVLEFLAGATVKAIAPKDSGLSTQKWNTPTEERDVYPAPAPDSPASLAIVLESSAITIPVEHWVDGTHNGRDNVKFWAGAGGYPGAALARDAIAIFAELGGNARAGVATNPFAFASPMSSSFRFDWRRDYVPLDAGFSPNEHKATMTTVGYPLVELLAAVGLQNARPQRIDKLAYRYAVTNALLPTVYERALLGGAVLGFPLRTFRMRLDWPGQEGQARCIVEAIEEIA